MTLPLRIVTFELMLKLGSRLSLVSGLTILSRFMGLARDVLFFTCFGVSPVGDAFILAFTIPNLFRRMLGEGTLSSAFIPVYSDTIKEGEGSGGKPQNILNQVVSRLFALLCIFTLGVCLCSWFLYRSNWMGFEKWTEVFFLNSIIFPYVIMICVSAILVGALNVHGKFFAGAFSPIILNFSMISCLLIYYFSFSIHGFSLAVSLSWAVVLGGLLQLALPWFQLKKEFHWRWRFDFSSSSGVERIKSLFIVGVFGAAVGQLNIMVSRFLAYSLDDRGALSYLFLSARLIELPLGVFAVSISTVFFPLLSKSFSAGNKREYEQSFARGFRLTLGILLPAAIGISLLADSILSVLFQWGKFGRGDVHAASGILLISCTALPFYGIAAYFVKAFHAQKEMRIPLRAALISFVANFVLSLYLMQDYGMYGLAWANVGSSMLQTLYLGWMLKEFKGKDFLLDKRFSFSKIGMASLCMFALIYFLKKQDIFDDSKSGDLSELGFMIPCGIIIYGIVLSIMKFPECKNFWRRNPF